MKFRQQVESRRVYRRVYDAMPRRYWIVIAAIGLALCLSSHGQAQGPSGGADQRAQETRREETPFSVPVRIVESEADHQARADVEEQSRHREIEDVRAQQGMDISSKRMADYALWQTWIVGIGTILVFGSLVLMIQANNAAQEAVEVTRQTGRDQSRAYLDITDVKIHFEPTSNIIGTVLNQGSTPARWYEVRTAFVFQPASEDGETHTVEFDSTLELSKPRRWASPPAGKALTFEPLKPDDIVSAEAVARAHTQSGILVLQGELRWETVYDETYFSQFLYHTHRINDRRVVVAIVEKSSDKDRPSVDPIKMQRPCASLMTYQVEGEQNQN